VDAKAEQQWSVAVIDVPFAAIAGARKIRGEVAADQACGCSNSGRLTAFTGFEKIKRDRCSPHVHGSCRMCLSRSVEFGLRLNLCQLDQSSHVRA
jgi:hypothetical protein